MSETELRQAISDKKPFDSAQMVIRAMYDECRYLMEDKKFIEKVREIDFDLMLVDGFVIAPCRFILPYHLGVPYVYQFSVSGDWALKIPVLPSFHPAQDITNTINLPNKMDFWQRTVNLFLYIANNFILPLMLPVNNSLLNEYAPGLTWQDLILKSELFLVTRDYMLEYPSVELPNVITTSGITVQPAKPLSADLEKIFQQDKHGVILVSFGSLAGALHEDIIDKLFETFSRLEQTIIMRFVGDIEAARQKAPANLHLMSWLPQNDILGHKNVLAFVTHCGNNGRYEALYHGVPMVGIPIFAEQHYNAFTVVQHGYGLQVESMDSFTVDELYEAISKVLTDPKFRDNTQHASAIMKADKMLPKEKLAYWVDHVMKFGGAHLRPACQDLPFYNTFMLDVMAFLLVVFLGVCYLFKRLLIRFCKKEEVKPKDD